jgi:hypothetical protein
VGRVPIIAAERDNGSSVLRENRENLHRKSTSSSCLMPFSMLGRGLCAFWGHTLCRSVPTCPSPVDRLYASMAIDGKIWCRQHSAKTTHQHLCRLGLQGWHPQRQQQHPPLRTLSADGECCSPPPPQHSLKMQGQARGVPSLRGTLNPLGRNRRPYHRGTASGRLLLPRGAAWQDLGDGGRER